MFTTGATAEACARALKRAGAAAVDLAAVARVREAFRTLYMSRSPARPERPLAHVEIYTRPFCPYCARALALLAKKGADYTEIDDAYADAARKRAMVARARRAAPPSRRSSWASATWAAATS